MKDASRDWLLPPDDVVRGLGVRALIATALGLVLWPAAIVAPPLALRAVLRVRRDRDRLADPEGVARPARIALVVSVVQLVVLGVSVTTILAILVG